MHGLLLGLLANKDLALIPPVRQAQQTASLHYPAPAPLWSLTWRQ